MAYSEKKRKEIVKNVCSDIETGLSLRKALEKIKLPAKTFYEWIDGDEVKSKQYARACEIRAENIFEDIIDIADDSSQDLLGVDEYGNRIENREFVNRSKLRVDARKWMLSKMMPKKYGEKLDIDHTTQGDKINIVNLGSGIKPPTDE